MLSLSLACALLLCFISNGVAKYRFQAIIDSGSTGSRVYIFRYKTKAPLRTLVELQSMRVNTALSTFYGDKVGLASYLAKMLSFAEMSIAPQYHNSTFVSLKATAGLRAIPTEHSEWIMNEVHETLSISKFVYNSGDTRVLSGGEEALLGLLATNVAFSNLTHRMELQMGAADLGGSSQQMAFVLPSPTWMEQLWPARSADAECAGDFRVTFPASTPTNHYLVPSSAPFYWTSPWSSLPSTSSLLDSMALSLFGPQPITVHVYARSFAGLGLVAAMNETFHRVAAQHRRYRLLSSYRKVSQLQGLLDGNDSALGDDAVCHSALDLSAENQRYCRQLLHADDHDLDSLIDSLENLEIPANNDGAQLYGEHSSWIHTSDHIAPNDTDSLVLNPCAPPGENLPYPDALSSLRWQGTGSFDSCVEEVRQVVRRRSSQDRRCLNHWNRQLPSAIVAMDNFPKLLEVLGLPYDDLTTKMTPQLVRQRGREICQLPWPQLHESFPTLPAFRVEQACFGASFLYSVLTDVYGMSEQEEVPVGTRLTAMDSHESFTIGWALGAAVSAAMNITYEARPQVLKQEPVSTPTTAPAHAVAVSTVSTAVSTVAAPSSPPPQRTSADSTPAPFVGSRTDSNFEP